jgi:hypothetical protein
LFLFWGAKIRKIECRVINRLKCYTFQKELKFHFILD